VPRCFTCAVIVGSPRLRRPLVPAVSPIGSEGPTARDLVDHRGPHGGFRAASPVAAISPVVRLFSCYVFLPGQREPTKCSEVIHELTRPHAFIWRCKRSRFSNAASGGPESVSPLSWPWPAARAAYCSSFLSMVDLYHAWANGARGCTAGAAEQCRRQDGSGDVAGREECPILPVELNKIQQLLADEGLWRSLSHGIYNPRGFSSLTVNAGTPELSLLLRWVPAASALPYVRFRRSGRRDDITLWTWMTRT